MDFYFRTMDQHEAEEIADDWKYDGIYSFYDFTNDMEDYSRFIDASKRGNNCFSCFTENELIGFYFIQFLKDDEVQIELGLKPNFTGKGLGLGFINAIVDHVNSIHGVNTFELIVARFNQRAINVYKKAGFMEINDFMQKVNGGEHEFLRMRKESL